MARSDWDKLRNQERDAKAEFSKDRLERPAEKPYTWFAADVTIDGTVIKNVGIRKRGFFGSADKQRPALNLELDRFVKGQSYAGRTTLKLHNNKQDATHARQVLAYRVFSAAGVPAPQCSLAQVTVNGTNMGIYTSLEAVDDAFLTRQFGSSAGNLYEASISDFRPGWVNTFEEKNNKKAGREDLNAVVAAIQCGDDQLLEKLGRVLDIDAFISFWAVESLLNHWDGFCGDQNNCFVYHDPKSGKLRFIAWGADSTFESHHPFVPFEPPASVWAVSLLPRRLYNLPETREKYRKRLGDLLNTVWNEKNLTDEANRLDKLVEGMSVIPPFQSFMQRVQLLQFIRDRRKAVETELKQPARTWDFPMRREAYSAAVGKITATFSTEWVPNVFMPAPAGAKAHVKMEFYGRQYEGDFTDVKAAPDITNPASMALHLTGTFKGVSVPVGIWISTPSDLFRTGKKLTAVMPDTRMALIAGQFAKPDMRLLGHWGAGFVQLDQAGHSPGAKVQGSLTAEMQSIPWEDFDLAKLKKAL